MGLRSALGRAAVFGLALAVSPLLACRARVATRAQPSAAPPRRPAPLLSTDPELAAAERAAIATLSDFRKLVSLPQPGTQYFEVQAVVRDEQAVDRVWLADVHAVEGGFEGAVQTQTQHVKSVQRGQRLRVFDEDVIDWAYFDRGKPRGGETRQVLARQKRHAALAEVLGHCAEEPRSADACASLGDAYASGKVGEQSSEVARRLYTDACAGGSAYGCNAAGWASLHGRGGNRDLPAATAFFERACRTGDEHLFACDSRGFALLSGLAGTKRDVTLGLRLLGKTCTRGLAPSCLMIELAKSKQLLRGPKLALACDVNLAEQVSRCTGEKDPQACLLAGTAIEVGACGAPRSTRRSAELLAGAANFGATWPSATRKLD